MDINETFQLARRHHLDGKLKEAEHVYREILRIQPSNVGAYYEIGHVFQDKGQLDEAATCYQKTIELNPNFAGAYNNLGNICRMSKKFDEAILFFQKAIELAPNFWGTYYNLGDVYYEKEEIDKAIFCYRKAVELNPDHATSYNNIGLALKDKGEIDEAMRYFQKALQLNPSNISAYFNIARMCEEKMLFKEANNYLKKAFKLDPNFAAIYDSPEDINAIKAYMNKGKINFIGDLSKEDVAVLIQYTQKASNILEFGVGGSTQLVCKNKNKSAKLISVDTLQVWIDITLKNLQLLSIDPDVTFFLYDNWEQSIAGMTFDLIFDDGFEDLRIDFALKAWRSLNVGGSLLIHDTRTLKCIRCVELLLDNYYLEIDSLLVNTNHSNITVINKKAREPYSNWNIDENKQPWEFGHTCPPKELWEGR
jgi:tetratricopeptide (TPR) repeat protein